MNAHVIFSRLRGHTGIVPRVAGTGKLAGLQTCAGRCRAGVDLLAAPALLQRCPVAFAWPRHLAELRAIAMAAAFAGMVATPAFVAVAAASTGQIGFYDGILDLDPVTSGSAPVVRPSHVLLTEDGSVALVNLRWSGWGASVARASGARSVNNCTPSCGGGKYINQPAPVTLTLSKPGVVLGHMVYRCYQIDPPDKRDDPADHGCLQSDGTYE